MNSDDLWTDFLRKNAEGTNRMFLWVLLTTALVTIVCLSFR